MSAHVEINGISFLPIKNAAKEFSYSRDYVARLAREGKIVATQVNRQWLIDTVSLQNFAEASLLEQSVRKQQLSLERKREQALKQEVKLINKEFRVKRKNINLQAQMVAACVLCLGLFVGAGVYTTTSLMSESVPVANLGAVSRTADTSIVYNEPLSVATPQPTTLYANSTEVEQPVFMEEGARSFSASSTGGVFLFDKSQSVQTAEDIASLFSDDVTVEFLGDNNGLVKYQNESGEIEYPFVSVPTGLDKQIISTAKVPLEVI